MDIYKEALLMHEAVKGKIDVISKVNTDTMHDLALAYSPGVAAPCVEISKDESTINTYTGRANMIAVVSDGSAVLGLGNIGAKASLPVMEGKCVLFRQFGGVSAFPICIDSQDDDTIVNTVKLLEPSFSGINLEDIASPRCFGIEERLKKETGMLTFHDDQHGTAIVTLAGLFNALRYYDIDIKDVKIAMSGAGAAGHSIIKLLSKLGAKNILVCDSKGIISSSRDDINKYKQEIRDLTNPDDVSGDLKDAVEGAKVFIGVSTANILTEEMVKSMSSEPIVFALANPEPEINYGLATKIGVKIIATGRSDLPNQVNNVLAFPGIFRGALDAQAREINQDMKLAAARAISEIVTDDLKNDYIIPKPFDERVLPAVATSVAKSAVETGYAPKDTDLDFIEYRAKNILKK